MDRETKKKFILIGICVTIVIGIFVRNLFREDDQIKDNQQGDEQVFDKEGITLAEVMRLTSYLAFDRSAREKLTNDAGGQSKDWFLPYQKAVLTAGYLKEAPNDAQALLTSEMLRELLCSIAEKDGYAYEELIKDLPERLKQSNANDEVMLVDFLTTYDLLLAKAEQTNVLSDTKAPVILEQEFFVLAAKEAEDSGFRLYSEKGDSYYTDIFKDYADIYSTQSNHSADNSEKQPRVYADLQDYMNRSWRVLTCGDEIIYVKEVLKQDVLLPNSWVVMAENRELQVFVNGVSCILTAEKDLSKTLKGQIADLLITNGKVTHITAKPEAVNGKVLMIGEEEIEIEGYGKLPLHKEFRIYKLYDELEMEPANGILVGYTITDFVISDGTICAALIKEGLKAENIRVLINTSGYAGLYHNKVEFTVDRPFTLETGNKSLKYKAGEKITLTAEDERLKNGRVKLIPETGKARISLLTVKRAYGTPAYRGVMEISATDQGLTIINELSLEEYLYSVIPSEMPTSYGLEALKVQAVCARSYAYNQIVANQYGKYGAHVDDSVNSQVYNNVEENEASILAVKESYGKVMTYKNKVVSAFYFSTSCGFTASVEDVWEGSTPMNYFTGSLQADQQTKAVMAGTAGLAQSKDQSEAVNAVMDAFSLAKEEDFRAFIKENTVTVWQDGNTTQQLVSTYDSDFLWYRWSARISAKNLSSTVNSALSSRYKANPQLILTKQKDGSYESKPVKSVGMIEKIKVLERGKSGIIKELVITGSKETVKICYQTNIRTLFAPIYDPVYRQDKSPVSGMTLLPSAFFVVDPVNEDGKTTAFQFYGGGYGHGVGMSQNGVKTMVKQGSTYDEIIEHYYNDTELGFLYKE